MRKELLLLLFFWGGVQLSAQTIVQQLTVLSQGSAIQPLVLKQPTGKDNLLIAMSTIISPGTRVVKVTDDAPGGGNTYQEVSDAASSCANRLIDIWFCENCKAGVNELKFYLSDATIGSVNSFLEVSGMALSSVVDGRGAHVSDGTVTSAGEEVGASITATAKDFIIARYFPTAPPTGVTPAAWTYNPAYVYMLNARPGTYQPTLTGGKAGGSFCMSMAAFKTAASAAAVSPPRKD
jgi:hypothetical protein